MERSEGHTQFVGGGGGCIWRKQPLGNLGVHGMTILKLEFPCSKICTEISENILVVRGGYSHYLSHFIAG
jgi:hypothetical protein